MGIHLSLGRSDELRRLALQVAVQLPESPAEARAVIDDVAELLERYVTRGPRPAWQLRPSHGGGCDSPVSTPAAVFWTVVAFLVSVPLAAAVVHLAGVQVAAAVVFFVGIAAAALVFGRCYGLAFGVAAALAHNVLIAPPLLQFSAPRTVELAFFVGYLIAALLLPWLASSAPALRTLAVSACARRSQARLGPSPD